MIKEPPSTPLPRSPSTPSPPPRPSPQTLAFLFTFGSRTPGAQALGMTALCIAFGALHCTARPLVDGAAQVLQGGLLLCLAMVALAGTPFADAVERGDSPTPGMAMPSCAPPPPSPVPPQHTRAPLCCRTCGVHAHVCDGPFVALRAQAGLLCASPWGPVPPACPPSRAPGQGPRRRPIAWGPA
jgi:hypothetical protein